MAQAAFEFSPLNQLSGATDDAGQRGRCGQPATATSGNAMDSTAFEIGWDHAHHRLTPPLRQLHDHNPVRQGWAAGRAAFGMRTLACGSAVRQWLALRLEAWECGQSFEGVQVNASFLARIAADECPVSRQPLTLCAARTGDAVESSQARVCRLNPQAAYAAGNLAVLSQRVADVHTGGHTRVPDGGHTGAARPDGDTLSADERSRLSVLASFATPMPHAQAALLPLRLLPPNRVRVINPVQALQVMLTLQFTQAGYARRLLGLSALMPNSEARQSFQIFMHTLLARRLSAGPTPGAPTLRRAMEDSWADALVNRRWQRLATRLSAADCELLLQRASRRALVVGGSRWVSSDSATEGWALEGAVNASRSARRQSTDVPAALAGAPSRPVQAAAGMANPGITRSLGSQKLAS
jgi:hypothetical protein